MTRSKTLWVPQFYSQLDSKVNRQALRSCFSSTCAMAVKFLKPSLLQGSNADDDYLRTVLKYGDTTQSSAQIRALQDYGVRGTFTQRLNLEGLKRNIDEGYPVAIGFLHKGPVSAPVGGGHWILVIGYNDTHAIVHDPFGELDVVRGGYVPGGSGRNQKYSWRNLLPRWTVEGPNSGWAMTFRRIEQDPITRKSS